MPVRAVIRHTLCGGWVGLAIGGIDALVATGRADAQVVMRLGLAGAAVGATLGLLFGAALGVTGALTSGVVSRWPGAAAARARALSPARVLSFAVAGAVALAAFAYPLRISERIAVSSLRGAVLTLGAALSIAVALAVSAVVYPVFLRWGARVSRHFRVSGAWSRGLLFTIVCATPTLAVGLVLIGSYGTHLGALRRFVWAAIFLVSQRALVLLLGSSHRSWIWSTASGLVLAVGVATGSGLVWPESQDSQALARAQFVPDGLGLVHRLTDVDRDGFSSVFGGRDCAPFDRSRFPGAREVLANGVDEDCNGSDLVTAAPPIEVLPKFSSHALLNDQPLNVLWYVVDSLRPDHLKLYGYQFETAPTLTALGAESWVFERAYSQSSTTALSLPSMFSGRNPGSMQWTKGVFPVASSDFSLAQTFSLRGYSTGLAVNSWVKDRLPGIQHGFSQVLTSPPEVNWRSGDYLLSNLFNLFDDAKRAGKPFFLVAHVDDVHHPYDTAEGKSVPQFASPGEKAGYDASIALFDQSLRVAIAHLKQTGLWDRTVIIVSADHGEEFGEHGGTIHSRTCYAEVTHVPLLVRIPRLGAQRISQPVALIDLAPTLLELLGSKSISAPLDGQSLFIPVFEPNVVHPDRPIFCSIYQVMEGRPPLFTRSVRRGRWSFFEEVKTGSLELYDQHGDPGEQHNVAQAPERAKDVAALRGLLASVHEGNLFRVSEGVD